MLDLISCSCFYVFFISSLFFTMFITVALKTHSVDVSEIRNLSKMGHFRHPVNVIVLSGLQVKLASLLTRVKSACEKIPFSSIRQFVVTILCNYRVIQDSVEMEKIQTLDALFDRLSIALKWHWYDPLALIIDYVDSPQLKDDLKSFGCCVKEFTEKKLTECSSLVESLTRLPSNGEFLETVLDVDPEAAEVQDILRSQEFLKLLGVSAALFVGERNSETTLKVNNLTFMSCHTSCGQFHSISQPSSIIVCFSPFFE